MQSGYPEKSTEFAPMYILSASTDSHSPAAMLRNTMFLAGTYVTGILELSSPSRSIGTSMSFLVSAERNELRSRSMTAWSTW